MVDLVSVDGVVDVDAASASRRVRASHGASCRRAPPLETVNGEIGPRSRRRSPALAARDLEAAFTAPVMSKPGRGGEDLPRKALRARNFVRATPFCFSLAGSRMVGGVLLRLQARRLPTATRLLLAVSRILQARQVLRLLRHIGNDVVEPLLSPLQLLITMVSDPPPRTLEYNRANRAYLPVLGQRVQEPAQALRRVARLAGIVKGKPHSTTSKRTAVVAILAVAQDVPPTQGVELHKLKKSCFHNLVTDIMRLTAKRTQKTAITPGRARRGLL